MFIPTVLSESLLSQVLPEHLLNMKRYPEKPTLPQLGYSKSSLHIFVTVSMRTLLVEDLKMTTAPNNFSRLTMQSILFVFVWRCSDSRGLV